MRTDSFPDTAGGAGRFSQTLRPSYALRDQEVRPVAPVEEGPGHRPETDTEKEGRDFSRPSSLTYAKGDGQPAGPPVETRDAFTVHPPS
jgi:hypothetical protein